MIPHLPKFQREDEAVWRRGPASPGQLATPLGFGATMTAVAVYSLALFGLATALPPATFDWTFSEQGPFEMLSGGFWLLLAVLLVALPGVPRKPLLVPAAVALMAAAREADLHKAFTADSLFKSNYYLDTAAPLLEKTLAGAVALLAFASVIGLMVATARTLRRHARERRPRPQWLRTSLWAFGIAVLCKLLDRMESVVAERTGFLFSGAAHRFVAAFEEGYECLLPVLFILALLQYQARTLSTMLRPAGTLRV